MPDTYPGQGQRSRVHVLRIAAMPGSRPEGNLTEEFQGIHPWGICACTRQS